MKYATLLCCMIATFLNASEKQTIGQFIQEKRWPLSLSGFSGAWTLGEIQKRNLLRQNIPLFRKYTLKGWQLPILSSLATYVTYEQAARMMPNLATF